MVDVDLAKSKLSKLSEVVRNNDRKIFVAGHNGLVGSEVSKEVVKKFGKTSLIVEGREN